MHYTYAIDPFKLLEYINPDQKLYRVILKRFYSVEKAYKKHHQKYREYTYFNTASDREKIELLIIFINDQYAGPYDTPSANSIILEGKNKRYLNGLVIGDWIHIASDFPPDKKLLYYAPGKLIIHPSTIILEAVLNYILYTDKVKTYFDGPPLIDNGKEFTLDRLVSILVHTSLKEQYYKKMYKMMSKNKNSIPMNRVKKVLQKILDTYREIYEDEIPYDEFKKLNAFYKRVKDNSVEVVDEEEEDKYTLK